MKPVPNPDYTAITKTAKALGFTPYKNRWGKHLAGVFTLNGYHSPVDLSACANDELSILKTATLQLSKKVDEQYHLLIEQELFVDAEDFE